MKSNQKGFVQILLVIGIVAVLAVIGYALYLKTKASASISANIIPVPSPYAAQYQQGVSSVAPIQNSQDLNSTATSLDSTNTTQIDAQLNALNSASSGF